MGESWRSGFVSEDTSLTPDASRFNVEITNSFAEIKPQCCRQCQLNQQHPMILLFLVFFSAAHTSEFGLSFSMLTFSWSSAFSFYGAVFIRNSFCEIKFRQNLYRFAIFRLCSPHMNSSFGDYLIVRMFFSIHFENCIKSSSTTCSHIHKHSAPQLRCENLVVFSPISHSLPFISIFSNCCRNFLLFSFSSIAILIKILFFFLGHDGFVELV